MARCSVTRFGGRDPLCALSGSQKRPHRPTAMPWLNTWPCRSNRILALVNLRFHVDAGTVRRRSRRFYEHLHRVARSGLLLLPPGNHSGPSETAVRLAGSALGLAGTASRRAYTIWRRQIFVPPDRRGPCLRTPGAFARRLTACALTTSCGTGSATSSSACHSTCSAVRSTSHPRPPRAIR
jgi:hypothetical protein